ncbi:MAG TPA: TlpA family protein disulfide reductase, partial [Crocinitomix sp.]|nr:TlpA family protein disulfide reductase [Crocinitomix sp.]
KKLPSVNIKDMEGNAINTAKVTNDGKPIVISFWATWCKPCKLELNTIADEYEDWQEETGVKMIAVSIDDQRTVSAVKPTVNANGWEYDIWLDPNGDFKRAMGVNFVPHTFLLDGNGTIVYSHNNFVPGDEEELYEQILKISK